MRSSVTLLLLATLALGGCSSVGTSRLNPLNWFGSHPIERQEQSQSGRLPSDNADPALHAAEFNMTDGRVLVASVTDLEVEQISGGVLVRATGVPPTQGYWKAALVADNANQPVDGVMRYHFVVARPQGNARVSTVPSRELTAAATISEFKLADTREIVVIGAENSRSSRR